MSEKTLREKLAEAGSKFDGHVTTGSLNEIMKIVGPIANELADMEQSFDLRWAADMCGIKMWQEAHPGKDHVWPDHGKLIFWLLEQLEKQ